MELAANSSTATVIEEQLTACTPPTRHQPVIVATETVTHVLTFGKFLLQIYFKIILFYF
jgi:hypothetical protein